MIKLNLKNEFKNLLPANKLKLNGFYSYMKKFIVSSLYSKYVIIGGGFTGITLANKLRSAPKKIPREDITIFDSIPEFTNYNKLKYFLNSELRYHHLSNLHIEDLLIKSSKFRSYEVFKIDPKENLIYAENSLRMQYEKLFICCGLQPDYSQVEGLLYALDDSQNNVFSSYHFEKAVSKMSVFSHCFKNRIINFQKLTQRDINFIEHGYGNIVYSCLNNTTENLDVNEPNNRINSLRLIDQFFNNFVECANNIVILFDILKKNRKGDEDKYIKSVNFYLSIPFSKDFFMNNLALKADDFKREFFGGVDINESDIKNLIDYNKIALAKFFFEEFEKRNIRILWEHRLKKVTLNNKLVFSNGKELEYNFCYVTPNLGLPNILKYGILNTNNDHHEKNDESEGKQSFKAKSASDLSVSQIEYFKFDESIPFEQYVDHSSLELKPFKNIYILGDTLKNFYDRQYQNVFLQAHILSNNIKVENYELDKKLLQSYLPKQSIFMDYDMNHYLFGKDEKIEKMKKNFLNKFYIEAFYREHNNRWMLKYFLQKRLGLNLKYLK